MLNVVKTDVANSLFYPVYISTREGKKKWSWCMNLNTRRSDRTWNRERSPKEISSIFSEFVGKVRRVYSYFLFRVMEWTYGMSWIRNHTNEQLSRRDILLNGYKKKIHKSTAQKCLFLHNLIQIKKISLINIRDL